MVHSLSNVKLKSIPEIFNKIVQKYPKKTALIFEDKKVTYCELWEWSTNLAVILQQNGITKGNIVALRIERRLELYIFMLAILVIGAIIVPINTDSPVKYIYEILKEAKVNFFIYYGEKYYTHKACKSLCGEQLFLKSKRSSNLFKKFQSIYINDPAIILMTSGSTGKAKSVLISHRGISRLSLPVNQLCNNHNDCYLQIADISFAASANEIWMSLLTGATLIIAPHGIPDLIVLDRLIKKYNVTILFLSGGLFRLFVEVTIDTLHYAKSVIVSGDFVNTRLFMLALNAGKAKIFNGFGCTENSAISSLYRVRVDHIFSNKSPIPVGTPLPLVEMVILNKAWEPCMLGEQGELFIAGAGLALGYMDLKLTSEKFITVRYKGIEKLLYRTDDRATLDKNLNILLIGRSSNFCKIRGYRVNITYVEHVLRSYLTLNDVLIVIEKTNDEPRLHAFYVTNDDALTGVDLARFLSMNIPGWMIPEKFTRLPSLFITSNGKKDRLQLNNYLLENT